MDSVIPITVKWGAELGPPIQMCNALTRNLSKPLAVILANCNGSRLTSSGGDLLLLSSSVRGNGIGI